MSWIPSFVFVLKVPAGNLSPALIAIVLAPWFSVRARLRRECQIVCEAGIAALHRDVDGGCAAVVLEFEARALAHQELRRFLLAAGDRDLQRRHAAGALVVDRNAA